MKPLDLNFICQTLNLPTPSENKPVSRIVTDSRDIRAGDVFFALAGERFDAHDFVKDVLAAGAAAKARIPVRVIPAPNFYMRVPRTP